MTSIGFKEINWHLIALSRVSKTIQMHQLLRGIIIVLSIILTGQFAMALSFDFVVAVDGTGNFTSIQKAIDACKAFPDHRIAIFVKNGTYKEKLVVPSCNTQLSIVGESPEKTVITYDDYFDKINRGRNSTFYT